MSDSHIGCKKTLFPDDKYILILILIEESIYHRDQSKMRLLKLI